MRSNNILWRLCIVLQSFQQKLASQPASPILSQSNAQCKHQHSPNLQAPSWDR